MKILVVIAWVLALGLLALACALAGLYLDWGWWEPVALFAGSLTALALLAWLRRRWQAWRLRRRLARPVGRGPSDLGRVDADWRAGMKALKRSRLSRFGAPLYVLPWYMALGPRQGDKEALLRGLAGNGSVNGAREQTPVLNWWLLRHCVVLDPAIEADGQGADQQLSWRRLLYWMMRSRRREPLNGLILTLSADWLLQSDEAQLTCTGQDLRKRLDELVRVYDARIPVYIVLTDLQTVPGFARWAQKLGPGLQGEAVGYLNPAPDTDAGKFIGDAFESILHRMFDLRVLQGVHDLPDHEAFSLPERLAPLAARLDRVLRPAFQATPYAETPLLQGLYLTGHGAHDTNGTGWFSKGVFNQAVPAQRHAWRPLERWRHWRRLLSHALVLGWLLVCVGAGVLLVNSSRIAEQELHAANLPGLNQRLGSSASVSKSLHALQNVRLAVLGLQQRPDWEQKWLPFQARVNQIQQQLADGYVRNFHEAVIVDHLDPLLNSSLPQLDDNPDDKLLAAWVQTLVRRVNLLEAALDDQDVYALPAPGTELTILFASAKSSVPNAIDSALLGDMYQDYLSWQTNREVLLSERQALQEVLAAMNLGQRSYGWLYAWVDLQGNLRPVRMSDFWNIPARPDEPTVPAALTPDGEQAVANFAAELGRASGNSELWAERSAEFRQRYLLAGLDAWYAFADAFLSAPDQLPDGTTRREVMSSLFGAAGPYRRLLGRLAEVGQLRPVAARPEWIKNAIEVDALLELAAQQSQDSKDTSAGVRRRLAVARQFGSDVLHQLPGRPASMRDGLATLRNDNDALNQMIAYRNGVLATVVSLQQGDGVALKTAIDIWSFGHDPNIKSPPLFDAAAALTKLRQSAGNATDPRTAVIWKLLAGPMEYALDYAGRNASCQLQQNWDNSVVSVLQGVNDGGLAEDLLFGERGQFKAFMAGDVRNFIKQDGNHYSARAALGHTLALNGQFYAFASLAQLREVSLASQHVQSKRTQEEVQALGTQQLELESQIAKLEATTANVTLSTVPPRTNADARMLPESVTLSLQCASGRITLENLNFPNQAVFPWTMGSCGDTSLKIRYAGFELSRIWNGSRGFIEFLKEFSTGEQRYFPADFPDQADLLQQAGVEWITVTYRQQGQAALVSAFSEADKLAAQASAAKSRLAQLQPGTAPGSTLPPPPPVAAVPRQIISSCMGASASVMPEPPSVAIPTSQAPIEAAHPSDRKPVDAGSYAVQVGIFSHPDPVLAQLALNGFEAVEASINLKGRSYSRIRIEGYASLQQAQDAAGKVEKLLRLKTAVLQDGKVVR